MGTNDTYKFHGLSEENHKEVIHGYTLVDITNTGVLAPYRKVSSFIDNASQIVNDEKSWNLSRNQQRNWETLIQLIGMIAQPTILQKPTKLKSQSLNNYHFGYTGKGTIWHFSFCSELPDIFDSSIVAGRLKDICNNIPIISGLKETIEFEKPVFDTTTTVNLYFEKHIM